jgi:RimJ/RimL family protein N-acetyltransferase
MGKEVRVVSITRDNWRDMAALDIKKEQARFLAPHMGLYLLARHYAEPEWEIYGLSCETHLIGGFSLRLFYEKPVRCGLERFFIHAPLQNRGLGLLSLQAIGSFVTKAYPEVRVIDLTVTPDNEKALALYTKFGFHQTALKEGLVWMVYLL